MTNITCKYLMSFCFCCIGEYNNSITLTSTILKCVCNISKIKLVLNEREMCLVERHRNSRNHRQVISALNSVNPYKNIRFAYVRRFHKTQDHNCV